VATAQIEVKEYKVDQVGSGGDGSLDELTFPSDSQILQSEAVLQPIITDLELDKNGRIVFLRRTRSSTCAVT
jgi:hypothetical protein